MIKNMNRAIKLVICVAMLDLFVLSPFLKSADAGYEEIEKEYNELLVNYYRNPQPDKIPAALERIAASDFIKNQPTDISAMTAYLFGRIARQDPSLISKYTEVFEKASPAHEGRVFILMVFQICGNEEVRHFLENKLDDKDFLNEKQDIQNVLKGSIPVKFSPLTREVKDGVDLDFLWAEFIVTGKKEPVVKIIDVLERPDIFQSRLQAWLRENHSKKEKQFLDGMLNQELRMDINVDQPTLTGAADLDNLFSAQMQSQPTDPERRESIKRMRKMLNISDDDLLYMAVKGAAMWSLRSNSQQHPKVFEYCKQEFERREGKGKIELAIILETVSRGTIDFIPTDEADIVGLKLSDKK